MIDERHEELAALYALDQLEGAEKSAFETLLARDAALRTLVQELRESSAALARTAPGANPPPPLKARVLATIEQRSQPEGKPLAENKIVAFPRWIPWAAAASFALVAAWFGQLFLTGRTEVEAMRTQQAFADAAQKNLENQLEAERIIARQQVATFNGQVADASWQLTEARSLLAKMRIDVAALNDQLKLQSDIADLKITTLASMLNNSPDAIAVAVWDPTSQEGVLKVEKFPALAADKDYQLWIVDPQYPAPVDGGVFIVDPKTGAAQVRFKAKQPIKAIAAYAITQERKGGVAKSDGPFLLLGKEPAP
jgi:anti-sigma-K factor RskA